MSSIRTKVLLVDDHAVVRAGFRYLLENKESYIVAEADSAEAAFEQYDQFQPDVVVLDISMPGMGGIEGLRRLRHKHSEARVLLFSMYDDPAFVTRAIKMGAKGYISKNCAPESLVKAIKTILAGRQYFSDDIAEQMKGRDSDLNSETLSLSPREFEVFRLLAEGQAVNEVANNLNLSPKTVSNHRSHLMDKLKLKIDCRSSSFCNPTRRDKGLISRKTVPELLEVNISLENKYNRELFPYVLLVLTSTVGCIGLNNL